MLLDGNGIGYKYTMKSVIEFLKSTLLRYYNEGNDSGNEDISLVWKYMDDILPSRRFED